MKFEDQFCSIEYAKRLKGLGVKQESLFHWILFSDWDLYFNGKKTQEYFRDCISAFTPAELMELLPNRITIKENEPFNSFRLRIEKSFYVHSVKDESFSEFTDMYISNYYCDSTECSGKDAWFVRTLMKNISDSKLADCLAKMMIYIIENKLIELPK